MVPYQGAEETGYLNNLERLSDQKNLMIEALSSELSKARKWIDFLESDMNPQDLSELRSRFDGLP